MSESAQNPGNPLFGRAFPGFAALFGPKIVQNLATLGLWTILGPKSSKTSLRSAFGTILGPKKGFPARFCQSSLHSPRQNRLQKPIFGTKTPKTSLSLGLWVFWSQKWCLARKVSKAHYRSPFDTFRAKWHLPQNVVAFGDTASTNRASPSPRPKVVARFARVSGATRRNHQAEVFSFPSPLLLPLLPCREPPSKLESELSRPRRRESDAACWLRRRRCLGRGSKGRGIPLPLACWCIFARPVAGRVWLMLRQQRSSGSGDPLELLAIWRCCTTCCLRTSA